MTSMRVIGGRRCGVRRLALWQWFAVAPGFLLVVVLLIYPLVNIALRSFNPAGEAAISSHGMTWANYIGLFNDPAARIILRNTFVLAGIAALISLVVTYPVAMFICQLPTRSRRIALWFLLLPLWTSVVVRMYSLQLILGQVNILYTQTAAIIGMTSYLVPYLVLILYSGMSRIDPTLMVASRVLGASPLRTLWLIFMPLASSATWAGLMLTFVIGLGFFITPALLGGSGDMTVAMYILQQVRINDWGSASAMGMCLLVIAVVLYLAIDRLFGIDRLATVGADGSGLGTSSGTYRWMPRWMRLFLGWWSGVAFAALTLPLVYVIVVSFSSNSYLSFPPPALSTKWYAALFSDPSWRNSIMLSLRVGLWATVIATIVGLLTALAVTRSRVLNKGPVRVVLILPVIVPVTLLAVGIYDIVLRTRTSGTLLGFALPHALLALPFTALILVGALAQVGQSYELAARTLGARPLRAFASVTLPLIVPGLAAAAAIAFVTSWDEVVIAMLVQFITPTLPVKLFTVVQASFTPVVAAMSSLILVGLVVLVALAEIAGWARRRGELRGTPRSAVNGSIPESENTHAAKELVHVE
ncbi:MULTISPECIES: ABC transporter permease subunit [unclassified Mesorhizobium]|uniref:ABC transporter permease n=1 Tax=unclassified Mesorhizobium TaxID=325217 RepID=UPI000FDC4DCA|nr:MULTISPECIES: ABC transporter permease subunit [unclassified Mesorhizobium]TGT71928.1 ABC transporter permease subunit [Mesorhizobium sp. M2E.F.Ca.ET.166.01.1.1]TGV99357.1 ABC transporter permease subunit [Mesorhizobium sp. M2E.F.Ca.ET.154.01.1.1]